MSTLLRAKSINWRDALSQRLEGHVDATILLPQFYYCMITLAFRCELLETQQSRSNSDPRPFGVIWQK